MEQFFADYLSRLESLHDDLKAALSGLDQAGLDWIPGEGMNSLCVIAVHVAGSERFWIGDVLAGEPSGRDRPAEFRAQGLAVDELTGRLDAALAYTGSVLGRLAMEELESGRTDPRDGRAITAGWVLAHVLAHTGIHAGHAQVTRQAWQQV